MGPLSESPVGPFAAPGRSIDGFTLEQPVHVGRRSTLWRVRREGGGLPLLMKLLNRGGLGEPAAIIGFEVEQMILPRLRGPHFPRYVAAGDLAGQPYLVMERIAGASLDNRLGGGPLPAAEVADIGARTAAALHDLHRQHVLHLDVAPDNILRRDDGEVVLVDFGLSRHDQLPDLMAEVSSLPLGAAPFISPEQVRGVRRDPRSDIFSLGAILYELLTGELPFGDPSSHDSLGRRFSSEPDPPRARSGECPDWLQEIILRCLEADPAQRYDSAAQLSFALLNPGQVVLTARAERRERSGFLTAVRRRLRHATSGPSAARPVSSHLDAVPIIMVAVDIVPGEKVLAQELRLAARRVISSEKSAWLICVTVRATDPDGPDPGVDANGESLPIKQLTALKQWARPLELPVEKLSFHVLTSPDPAAALVTFARANGVEHIIVGARGSSTKRRPTDGVSARVAAAAPCTVTVVRTPEADQPVEP